MASLALGGRVARGVSCGKVSATGRWMLNAGTHSSVGTVCALEAIANFLRTASADFAIASAEDEAEEEDEDEETDEVSESESESESLELVSESESELELEELLSESELELEEDCACGA